MLPNNVYLRVFYCYFNLGILGISTVIFSIQFSLSMLETYIYTCIQSITQMQRRPAKSF